MSRFTTPAPILTFHVVGARGDMVDVAAVAFMSRNLNQPQKFHRFETVAVSTRAQGLENVRDGLCAALFVQVEHQDERNVVPDEDVLAPLLLQMAQSSFVNSTRVQAVFTMPDYIWFGALHPHVQHMLSDPQSAAQVRVLGPAQYKADTLNVLGSSVTYVEVASFHEAAHRVRQAGSELIVAVGTPLTLRLFQLWCIGSLVDNKSIRKYAIITRQNTIEFTAAQSDMRTSTAFYTTIANEKGSLYGCLSCFYLRQIDVTHTSLHPVLEDGGVPFIAETATGCVLIAEGGMSTNNMQMAVDDMNRGTIGVSVLGTFVESDVSLKHADWNRWSPPNAHIPVVTNVDGMDIVGLVPRELGIEILLLALGHGNLSMFATLTSVSKRWLSIVRDDAFFWQRLCVCQNWRNLTPEWLDDPDPAVKSQLADWKMRSQALQKYDLSYRSSTFETIVQFDAEFVFFSGLYDGRLIFISDKDNMCFVFSVHDGPSQERVFSIEGAIPRSRLLRCWVTNEHMIVLFQEGLCACSWKTGMTLWSIKENGFPIETRFIDCDDRFVLYCLRDHWLQIYDKMTGDLISEQVIDLTCLRIAGSGPHLVFWMTNGLQYANIDSVKREADKLALTNLMSLHNKFKSFELLKVIGEWVYCHVENQVLRMHVRLFSVYQLFPYDYDFPIMSGMTRPDRILLLQRQANDRLLIVFERNTRVYKRLLQESTGTLLSKPSKSFMDYDDRDVHAVSADGKFISLTYELLRSMNTTRRLIVMRAK